jgi:hypothetical protein
MKLSLIESPVQATGALVLAVVVAVDPPVVAVVSAVLDAGAASVDAVEAAVVVAAATVVDAAVDADPDLLSLLQLASAMRATVSNVPTPLLKMVDDIVGCWSFPLV